MCNLKKTIYIFTLTYPYTKGGEASFISKELSLLAERFGEVVIIPQYIGGVKQSIFEKNVIVDERFAVFLEDTRIRLFDIFNFSTIYNLFSEIIRKPKLLLSIRHSKSLVNYLIQTIRAKKWLTINFATKNQYQIFYTFWFTSLTSAILDYFGRENKVITRVHGIDLYLDRNLGYIPLRKQSIKKIDKIYCASLAAKKYLKKLYPKYTAKFELARLGVSRNDKYVQKKKEQSIFKIVSCSALISLNRVDLILKAVIDFARKHPDTKIEYSHFGEGEMRNHIEFIIKNHQIENLTVILKGNVPNEEILKFYQANFIDVFVHLSLTEGGCPVAIQEAMSFGIPIIGAANGGVIEMFSEHSEFLLSSNPRTADVSQAIQKIFQMPEDKITELRNETLSSWNNKFNAEKNFKEFVTLISEL